MKNQKRVMIMALLALLLSSCAHNLVRKKKIENVSFSSTKKIEVDKVGLVRDLLRKNREINFKRFDRKLTDSVVLASGRQEILKGLARAEVKDVKRQIVSIRKRVTHRDALCKKNKKNCINKRVEKGEVLNKTEEIFNRIITKYNNRRDNKRGQNLDIELKKLSIYLKNIKGIEEVVSNKIAEMTREDKARSFQGLILLGESSRNKLLKKRINEMLEVRIEGKDAEYNDSFKRKLYTIADRVNYQFYLLNNFCFQNRGNPESCELVGNLFAALKFDYSYLKFQVENLLKTQAKGMKIAAKKFIEIKKGKRYLKKLVLKNKTQRKRI